ncbi:MAG: hypothetical protein IJ870_01995 [Alphaproteobacteria bacterium]|nr:hypothetical protein [Alphaproteobacteria bacterium]
MKKCLLSLFFVLFSFSAKSEMPDFSKYFEVDLDAPLPDLDALKEEYMQATEIYEPRYVVSWDMGPTFDRIWRNVITSYGTSERRIRSSGEEDLTDMIASLPKEYYPYIGPFLHSVPGIPEKILNMPGIKETKNKFPERIAPQLQGIEDLEFLSPYLYILLMPEMWPENNKPVETPQKRRAKIPPTNYNPQLYANIFESLPKGGFGGANARGEQTLEDRLRTLKVSKTSPLTTADVVAFTKTLDGVLAFGTHDHKFKLVQAGSLLDYYEAKNGTALDMNTLKDIVNPCQRLALKIKWAGLETEFSKNIASEGFNLKDWALTCDKTIKAYRTILVSDGKLSSLELYKKGVYNAYIQSLAPKWRDRQFATMQGMLKMYETNKNDVLEALKNESIIKEKLKPFGSLMLTSPLSY